LNYDKNHAKQKDCVTTTLYEPGANSSCYRVVGTDQRTRSGLVCCLPVCTSLWFRTSSSYRDVVRDRQAQSECIRSVPTTR